MILVNDLRAGMTFTLDEEVYLVLDKTNNKTARSKMSIKTKVKNMRSGAITELSWTSGDKAKRAHMDKKEMQYLYDGGTTLVFMDTQTYEQVEIEKSKLEWEQNFLKESQNIDIIFFDGEVLGVNLPDKVALKVIECEPAVKGDTATAASKSAIVETNFEVKVPLFIEEGEEILINTSDGKYSSRA